MSQDPIGLVGNMPNLYSYVDDSNWWVDALGLAIIPSVTKGASGEILTANATITPADLGTETNTNASSRRYARSIGNQSDDAGHIIGKQLGGSGGKANVFPQSPNVNRGQFAQFEGRVANLTRNKGDVKINVSFDYAKGGTRPTSITYIAEAADGTKISQRFRNPCG